MLKLIYFFLSFFGNKLSELNVSNTFEGLGKSHAHHCVTSRLLKILHLGTEESNCCSFETEMFSNPCLEWKSYKTLKAEMVLQKHCISAFYLCFSDCPHLSGNTVVQYISDSEDCLSQSWPRSAVSFGTSLALTDGAESR